MKRLYICGSFRYVHEMSELEDRLKKENVGYSMPKEMDRRGILGCLDRIDDADVVYVINPEGYVGRSVCVDIGYAYARKKPIYVMHSIDDPPVMSLILGILSFEELVGFLKQNN